MGKNLVERAKFRKGLIHQCEKCSKIGQKQEKIYRFGSYFQGWS